MRRLLAILLVVATPAWAANVDPDDWGVALTACDAMGGHPVLCWLKHVPEPQARIEARAHLARCDADPKMDCTKTRAYIKQRWGY